jgi:hypothetical protein
MVAETLKSSWGLKKFENTGEKRVFYCSKSVFTKRSETKSVFTEKASLKGYPTPPIMPEPNPNPIPKH